MRAMAHQVMNAVVSIYISYHEHELPSCPHLSYQVLADKCFHGDIHGGNLLLLKDGRLGLIGACETPFQD